MSGTPSASAPAEVGSIEAGLRQRILQERQREERLSDLELRARIGAGDHAAARGTLLFFTDPSRIRTRLAALLADAEQDTSGAPPAAAAGVLRLLTFLAIDLASALAEWRLARSLSPDSLQEMTDSVLASLQRVASRHPGVQEDLLTELRADAHARLKAEAVAEEEAALAARQLAGSSLAAYARRVIDEVRRSNLRAAARAYHEGRLATVLGNDYADFLPSMIWLGGSFVTTNPVLIKLAWDIEPSFWNRHVDEVILSRWSPSRLASLLAGEPAPVQEAVEAVAGALTVSVVERNCRMLRPIFLLTGGEQGYVSLQVDPAAHDDPRKMAADAAALYAELEHRLGGVPNVVIKVPSTSAGLEAARMLTSRGIGVTITLTFSLFQALPFARVLQAGRALVSYIAVMNGRLAFPVRDEMKARGVPGGVEAARWAGVEVARKICARLYGQGGSGGLGIDAGKVKVMIASLRIYDDWIPDISEIWGVPLITVFPNVRRAFDATPRQMVADRIGARTPEEALRVMQESEVFRQAWWTEEDGAAGRPSRPLTLEPADSEAVADWAPVRETLTQFIGTYREMCGMVKARLAAVAGDVRITEGMPWRS